MFHTFAAADVKRLTLVERRRRLCQRFYIAVTSLTHPIYVILPTSCEPGKELGEVGSSENSDEHSAAAIRHHVVGHVVTSGSSIAEEDDAALSLLPALKAVSIKTVSIRPPTTAPAE